LHVKEKKGERVRSTPPTTRCFGGQQWPAAGKDQGGGAREGGGCGAQADAEKKVQGSSSGFIEREREGKAATDAGIAKDGHGAGGFNSNSRGALKGG
jgi:hypothetical protein